MTPELQAWRDALVWEQTLAGFGKGVESYIHGGSIPCRRCGGTGHCKSWHPELQDVCPNCQATGTSNSNNNDWSGEYQRSERLKRFVVFVAAEGDLSCP